MSSLLFSTLLNRGAQLDNALPVFWKINLCNRVFENYLAVICMEKP